MLIRIDDVMTLNRPRLIPRILILAAFALAAGCSGNTKSLDDQEIDSPRIQNAIEKERIGDVDGAIKGYSEILDSSPLMARAHLGLAFLLDKPDKDYVLAIYHYRRYLELRPRTEKREMIENRIRMAKESFAAALLRQTPRTPDALNALETENASLKMQIQALQDELAKARGQPPGGAPAETSPSPRHEANASASVKASAARTYTVQPGDTLSRIATKVYSDPGRWKDIFDANRSLLKSRDDIKTGQELTIPR